MVPMKIAIADDELYVCQQIRECLLQYSTQKNVDMDAPDIYTDCRTLYNTDLSGKRYDVVFMDIDFSGKNNITRLFSDSYAVRERCSDGLALGTYLRHILGHQNFDIIYVTSHENYAIHAIPICAKAGHFSENCPCSGRYAVLSGHFPPHLQMYQQQISGACAGVPCSLSEQLRKKGVSANYGFPHLLLRKAVRSTAGALLQFIYPDPQVLSGQSGLYRPYFLQHRLFAGQFS